MNLHHVLEWALAGAFLVCGVRQFATSSVETRPKGDPLLGVLCGIASVGVASAHVLPVPFVTWLLIMLGILATWRLRSGAGNPGGMVWLFIATLCAALFASGGLLLQGPRPDPVSAGLVWSAVAVPAVVFAAYSMGLARKASTRPGRTGSRYRLPLLALAVALATLASMQHLWTTHCFYAAGFVALLGAMLFAEGGAEDDTVSMENPPASDNELSHTSRLAVVGELTASIAHEINQPLSAILSNVDTADILLEDSEPAPDELRKIIRDIRRDGLRASDVIRNVRTMAQKRDPDLVKLDLNDVVESVVELLGHEMRRRGIGIVVIPYWKSAYVRGDQSLLVQVLINLVVNAMDALEAGRIRHNAPAQLPPVELKIGISQYDEIHLSVVDEGPGIPDEHLDQLFSSFYTSKSHGMGLGLSISRSILSAHGGRIQATNNPGQGATFHIFLPPYSDE
ncbi:HAMP domain-containing sensor histidine kinase [Pseudoxanthomonas sp. 3HH-4]|uniref:sensor histidine kinase n=1 Tax=Pseudoxanthomonas sp. 3HH-4 TaxID=1690214 RepID=UPI001639AD2E|nr:HAMP domain-containing sensor histidine kinase [Pseudoxanthomonas sp. 3HH-4]